MAGLVVVRSAPSGFGFLDMRTAYENPNIAFCGVLVSVYSKYTQWCCFDLILLWFVLSKVLYHTQPVPVTFSVLGWCIACSNVHKHSCLCCCTYRDLDRPADFQLIQRLGNRAAVVCAPQDMWFPAQHYQQMRSALPEVEVRGRGFELRI